jgi:hypothetical protein
MTGTLQRWIDSFNDRLSGPLRGVSYRKVIVESVTEEQMVPNSGDSDLAIAYAVWFGQRRLRAALSGAVFGVLGIFLGATTTHGLTTFLGIVFLVGSAYNVWMWTKARRSIALNEARLRNA